MIRRDAVRDPLRIVWLRAEACRLLVLLRQQVRLVWLEEIDHPLDVERRDLDLVAHVQLSLGASASAAPLSGGSRFQ